MLTTCAAASTNVSGDGTIPIETSSIGTTEVAVAGVGDRAPSSLVDGR